MKKWKYKYIPIQRDLLEDFNKLGEEGWELVLMNKFNYIFKKEITI